jgi:4-amino-4-deoxy-L-arabinose transferase-like glycosyltransferase
MPRTRLALLVICMIAIAHGLIYMVYQRPDWNVSWTDQGGYRMLGHGFAAGGGFTRYPGAVPFVPEAIRQPGYPLFVAMVYRIAGESQTAVVIAQILVFAMIPLLVFNLARRVVSTNAALGAALLTALYSPLPYFAALVLTELFTTFVVTATMLCAWQAMTTRRPLWWVIAGVMFGFSPLSRPVYILLGPFTAGLALLFYCRRHNWLPQFGGWILTGAFMLLTLSPFLLYNYRHFGIIDISPVGLGRPVFEASWQGVWPGRVQDMLTDTADSPLTEDQVNTAVQKIAADQRLSPDPMLEYIHQWRRIHAIWDTPTDPQVRFKARIIAQEEYMRTGMENIRRDLAGYLKRRIVRGQPVLWITEIPIRQSDINSYPSWVIRAVWLPQALLVILALIGAVALTRQRRWDALVILFGPLVYTSAVHFLLLTESRQSLPVKPLVIVLAVVGVMALLEMRKKAAA